jgi:flagellar protein FliS
VDLSENSNKETDVTKEDVNMQGYGQGINAYRKTQVGTADPRELVIMCYEAAIKQLGTAREAYETGDYEAKARAVAKVHDTVELLMQSLDFEKGGNVARNLQALYSYVIRRLTDGDLRRDTSAFDEAARIFEDLLTSWRKLPKRPDSGYSTPSSVPGETGGQARAVGGLAP